MLQPIAIATQRKQTTQNTRNHAHAHIHKGMVGPAAVTAFHRIIRFFLRHGEKRNHTSSELGVGAVIKELVPVAYRGRFGISRDGPHRERTLAH